LKDLEDAIINRGFKGIKLHPVYESFAIDGPLPIPILELAEKLDVPVYIHSGYQDWCSPYAIGVMASKYPKLKVILGHLGTPLHRNAIEVADRTSNIILDASWNPIPRVIQAAIDTIGARRVVYGSDYPFLHLAIETLKIDLCDISDEDKSLIMGENMRELLKI
jgi:predicted TIM-barrel fold metal-dependent hydrolase